LAGGEIGKIENISTKDLPPAFPKLSHCIRVPSERRTEASGTIQ